MSSRRLLLLSSPLLVARPEAVSGEIAVSGSPDIQLDQGGTPVRPGDVSTDIEVLLPASLPLRRRTRMRPSIPLAISLAATCIAASAAAVDGMPQINQACAVQTGCFTGDTAGYPVTIAAPGSYVLTGNLVLPDANTTGILVSAPSVHIDLNGFEIVSAGCLGSNTNCTPASGAGRGVTVTSFTVKGLVVENGSITGMGSHGLSLGQLATASRLRVRWNGGHGIQVDSVSSASGNTVYGNVGTGIYTSSGATVANNTVYACSEGIRVYSSSIISSNTVYGNAIAGIRADNHSVVIAGNATTLNGSYGIITSHTATITGNQASWNQADGIFAASGSTVSGNTAVSNDGDGIQAYPGSSVSENTVQSNGVYGLALESTTTYRANTAVGNANAGVLGGVNQGQNFCSGTGVLSASCP